MPRHPLDKTVDDWERAKRHECIYAEWRSTTTLHDEHLVLMKQIWRKGNVYVFVRGGRGR